MTAISPAPAAGRIAALDLLRGLAILAMIAYHLIWDLAFFGLIGPATQRHPLLWLAGAVIAASFLAISGMALSLLHATAGAARDFRERFLRRLAIVGGAALLVTLGTILAMGDAFVRFGILHCIALSSLLALPFLAMPRWVAAVAAIVLWVLPPLTGWPAFGADWLSWTGLGDRVPPTVDHVPVAPFGGFVLAGVAIAPWLAPRLAAWPSGPRAIGLLGRWSLPIYLIHQPILFAVLWLATTLGAAMAPSPAGLQPATDLDTREFRRTCRESCRQAGSTAEICERTCGCVERDLRAQDLWRVLMASESGARDPRVQAVVQACSRAATEAPR
jgi:uncharacterized membrane protein